MYKQQQQQQQQQGEEEEDSSPDINATACVFVTPTRVCHTGTGLVQLDRYLMMRIRFLPVVHLFFSTRH